MRTCDVYREHLDQLQNLMSKGAGKTAVQGQVTALWMRLETMVPETVVAARMKSSEITISSIARSRLPMQ